MQIGIILLLFVVITFGAIYFAISGLIAVGKAIIELEASINEAP